MDDGAFSTLLPSTCVFAAATIGFYFWARSAQRANPESLLAKGLFVVTILAGISCIGTLIRFIVAVAS